MTLPTEYRKTSVTVGNAAIKHPIYVFQVNLDRLSSEKFGPNTNLREGQVLHPDMYNNSPDQGRANMVQHQRSNVSWLPGFLGGENVYINDDGTITAYGQKAIYLKRNYADANGSVLTLLRVASLESLQDTYTISVSGGTVAAGVAYNDKNGVE